MKDSSETMHKIMRLDRVINQRDATLIIAPINCQMS